MSILTQSEKLFIIIAVTGFIALLALSYFALYPLYDDNIQSQDAAYQSLKFTEYLNKATLLIYVVLIFIANLVFRNIQKGIYLFYAWLFFSATTLFSYIYIAEEYFHFKQRSGLWQGEFSLAGFGGMILCLVAATAAFINYAVLKKLVKK